MTKFPIHFSVIFSIIFAAIFVAVAFAEDTPQPLVFSAINAGYKDDAAAQNYDFIELLRQSDDKIDLGSIRIEYFNSSDKSASEITFAESATLETERLVLGYHGSPQYADAPPEYTYSLSSSGLASTGGRLKLWQDEDLLDEVCWGKTVCEKNVGKFSTKAEDNQSYVLRDGKFIMDKYYPDIDELAISHPPDPIEEQTLVGEPARCEGLVFSEILSYYVDDSSEQFVELYNSSEQEIMLDGCYVRFKSKLYPLVGSLAPATFYMVEDIPLTKNPNNTLGLDLIDDTGVVDTMSYAHGQKKGIAYARFNYDWRYTYQPTPGADNIYQEFRSCPEGKIINPETGNCIKEAVLGTVNEKTCAEGQYLNPLTGRCKKYETTTEKTCPEGYERNPETNRCRKIVTKTANDYPVEEFSEETSYDNPKVFIAAIGLIVAGVLVLAVVVWQYREEIRKLFYRLLRRHPRKTNHDKLISWEAKKS